MGERGVRTVSRNIVPEMIVRNVSPNIYLNLGPIVCGCLPALGTHCRKGSSWTVRIMTVSAPCVVSPHLVIKVPLYV